MTLRAALLQQARSCAALGSPFMEMLMTALAEDWPDDSALGRLCAGWKGDVGPGGASLPLRIAGGLHALVLTGRAPNLAAVYPPATPPDPIFRATVLEALAMHEMFLIDWMQRAPQTNEVRRSAALIPAAHLLAARHPLPFVLSELGASGGLNLMFDRFALTAGTTRLGPPDAALTLTPQWQGAAPAQSALRVDERRGVDLNPLDLRDPAQALRLAAYLWPDQPERVALTGAAIAVQDAEVDKGDAVDWLERRLATDRPGRLHLIYHTVAWQYFPPPAQARGTALIEAAGARATAETPLAWLGMENDGGEGAALTLRLWPGDLRLSLGRIDFHGRWVKWNAPNLP